MTWVASAVMAVAAIGGSIYSANKTAGAMEDAANTQAGAADRAAQLQDDQYQQTSTDMLPWRTAGEGALNQLSAGLQPGGDFSQFRMDPTISDPSYAWRKQEGINALASSGAAKGNYGSGNMGVALQNYGQNLASTEYQNEYARQYGAWQDKYNRLAGLAGTGQTAATNLGQMGMTSAANQGNLMVGGANALAAGQVGAAQAQAGGITGATNAGNSLVGNYLNYQNQQQMMDLYRQGQGSVYSPSGYNIYNPSQQEAMNSFYTR